MFVYEKLFSNFLCGFAVTAVFISCRPPIDPVKIVYAHFSNVERTGLTQTRYFPAPTQIRNLTLIASTSPPLHHRYALRFTPVSDSCAATLPNIIGLADRLFPPAFHSDPPRGYKVRLLYSMSCALHAEYPLITFRYAFSSTESRLLPEIIQLYREMS